MNPNGVRGIYAGVWDLLHPGHLWALKWARQWCDRLTVAINVFPTLDTAEKEEPIESEADRYLRLRACRLVDEVLTYRTGEAGLLKIYAKGYDVAFIGEEHQFNDYTEPSPARPVFVPRFTEHSSTRLRGALREKAK